MTFWNDAKILELQHYYNLGWSFSKIGAQIGCTRNAALGKAHRLGLVFGVRASGLTKERQPLQNRANANKLRIPRQPTVANKAGPKEQPKKTPVWKLEPLPETKPADVARVTFANLEDHNCRWPVGDPRHEDFGYCGLRRYPGASYCKNHLQRSVPRETIIRTPSETRTEEVSAPVPA